MTTLLLTIHLMLALALIGAVLLQRSEGGALGIGGGGGGGGFMSGRGTANLLTRTTAVLAALLMLNSIVLTSQLIGNLQHLHAYKFKTPLLKTSNNRANQASLNPVSKEQRG